MNVRIRRFFSYCVDWYVITLILDIIVRIYTRFHFGEALSLSLDSLDLYSAVKLLLILFVVNCIYFVFLPYICNGATIGKKIFHIKIVSQNEKKVSLSNLFAKEIIGNIIIEGAFYPMSNYISNIILLLFGKNVVQILTYVHILMGLVSMMLILKNNRMIHDYIGHTEVVIENN